MFDRHKSCKSDKIKNKCPIIHLSECNYSAVSKSFRIKQKMNNSNFKFGIMISIFSILFASCANLQSEQKSLCERSSGEYKTGFSETAGPFPYCKCPLSKYEENLVCKEITQNETELCNQLDNNVVNCQVSESQNKYFDEGVCECIFHNSESKSYFTFNQLRSMECQCSDDGCGCLGVGISK